MLLFCLFVCIFGKDVATKPAKAAAVGIQGRHFACSNVVLILKIVLNDSKYASFILKK